MEPESGTIILRGKPLAPHTANIGYMLQTDHLFEWRTVYRNIVLGLEIQKKMTPAYLHHVNQLMEAYGLWAFRNSRPSELSGGMRQRAALILSLIHIFQSASNTGIDLRTWQAVPSHTLITYFPLASKEKFS